MTVISGALGAAGSMQAADAQSEAARYAADLQWKMYQTGRQDMLPFLKAGYARLPFEAKAFRSLYSDIMAGPGTFEKSPYYDTLKSGINEAAQAYARQGLVTGGGAGAVGKPLERYAMSKASELRGNWLNEWLNTKLNPKAMVAYGQNQGLGTSSQLASNALETGRGMGAAAMYGGEAEASGYLGAASAFQGASAPIANYFMMKNLLGQGGNGWLTAANAGQWAGLGNAYGAGQLPKI